MVFAVNPTANKTFETFQSNALATASNSTSTTPSASGAGSGSSTTGSAGSTTSSSAAMPNVVVKGATGMLAILGLVAGVAL